MAKNQSKYMENRSKIALYTFYAEVNVMLNRKFSKRFAKHFGLPIQHFLCSIGFDVVKFDQFIKPNKKESMMDAIIQKYGKLAGKVISDIIKSEREFVSPAKK